MNTQYEEILDHYYKQKDAYGKEIHNYVQSIVKDPLLSRKEKQNKYKQFKPKCINCKRPVGTIFLTKYDKETTSRILSAMCGDRTNPCKLKMVINTGNVQLFPEVIKEQEEDIKNSKNDIIIYKNRLIFKYITEEDAVKVFEKIKASITDTTLTLSYYLEEYLNIVDSKEKKANAQRILEESYINTDIIKECISKFDNTNDTQYVKDAVDVYVKKLKPLLDEGMKLKYNVCFVEHDDNKCYLIQRNYGVKDIEFYLKDPEVVENIFDNVRSAKTSMKIRVKPKTATRKTKKIVVMDEELGSMDSTIEK